MYTVPGIPVQYDMYPNGEFEYRTFGSKKMYKL